MVPIGGVVMGVIALAFVALANVTSTTVSLFAGGLALRHIPGLLYWAGMRFLIPRLGDEVPKAQGSLSLANI